MDSGDRERTGGGAAGAADGYGDQRDTEPAAAVEAGAAGGVFGDCGELLGIRSLAFAVGSYLSIATTLAIFVGGAVRWLSERGREKKAGISDEVSSGSLYASGLIAAGGVFGLLGIFINLLQDPEIALHVPRWLGFLHLPIRSDLFAFGPKWMPYLSQAPIVGVIMFALLAFSLLHFARKQMS